MMRAMTTDPPRTAGFFTFLLRLVRLAVLGLVLYGAYRVGDWLGFTRGRNLGHAEGLEQGIQQDKEDRTLERSPGPAVAMTVPAEEVALALTTLDPDAAPPEFIDGIDRLYRDLLAQTARVYPFPAGQDVRALDAWADRKQRVADGLYQQLHTWAGQRAPLPGMRLSLTHHAAATDLETLLRDQACGAVRELWAMSTAPGDARPILPALCVVVERELIGPWGGELVQAAMALDVESSVTAAETRYRKTIMELATAEMEIDGVVRQDYESKLFEGWVIESTDHATLEVRGKGIVKSGFQMDQAYSVSVLSEEKKIRVTLPRAKILSNTMVPSFSQEKEGWWTSLGSTQRNQALRALQEKVERQALADGILKEAEDRAVGLVQDLFSPLTMLPGSPYTVVVEFQGQVEPVQ